MGEPLSDPCLHGLRNELGAVVAADELRRAPAFSHGGVQDADHVGALPPAFDFQGHALAAELIANRQPLEPPSGSPISSPRYSPPPPRSSVWSKMKS